MSSKAWSGRRLETRALDVLDAIGRIREYIKNMKLEDYLRDGKTQAAVERELEKISEACIKLRSLEENSRVPERSRLERRFPEVPWSEIRGIGNRLRHEYGRVDAQTIWVTVGASDDLATLERALLGAFPAQRSD